MPIAPVPRPRDADVGSPMCSERVLHARLVEQDFASGCFFARLPVTVLTVSPQNVSATARYVQGETPIT